MLLLRVLIGFVWFSSALSVGAQAVAMEADQCRPQALQSPTVVGMAVHGELSGFDPCHLSVSFKIPTATQQGQKPPLLIAVHGGGGRPDAEAITQAFFANGMATLIFDAYQHNGVPPRMGNAYRQMMLYKVALQAYQWALTRPVERRTTAVNTIP